MDDEYRWYLLRKKRIEDHILSSIRAFRSAGIEPILIKGWAAARNYPPSRPRFFGDIDLAVSASDFDAAFGLVERPDSGATGIDLHRELRHLDTVEWDKLLARSELVPLEDEMIRVLAAEDHLRVMCVHWLTNGGESKERLWDIVYAVQNRSADFDWDRCLSSVSDNRRGWIISTIGLAHRYLDLDIDDLPFADQARRLPTWLTRCVEREWKHGLLMRSLHVSLRDPVALYRQIRKRIPPNPIQATVDCEGRFDDGSRVGYQVRDIFKRFGPSVRRVIPAAFETARGRN